MFSKSTDFYDLRILIAEGVVELIIYTVQPMDSIYQIAKKFHVPPEWIITANDLDSPEELSVGQSLIIPKYTKLYTAKQGDTLSEIAKQYELTLRELYQKNPQLKGKQEIIPGESLVLEYQDPPERSLCINGYAYPFIDLSTLQKTLPYLTYLTVFSYRFTPSGDLITIDDSMLLETAKEYGVAPILLLSNLTEEGTFNDELAHQLLQSPIAQQDLIENLLSLMKEKGYVGLDMDFEFLYSEDKDAYASFMNQLKENLANNGFHLIVSLSPKVSGDQTGVLYEAHDYPALGNIVDIATIMAYEWGYSAGPPMAIAPLNEVTKVLDYAKTAIPKEKIRLGVPNYGYNFQLPYEAGVSLASSISNVEATELAFDKDAEIRYDFTAQSPWFDYYEKGKQQRQVWFEDAQSVNATMDLVDTYGIHGISVWNIMKYFPQLWQILSQRYQIESHFAKETEK